MQFKEGDAVRVIDREVTPADTKAGTYYPHLKGLAGVVDKIYDKEICVKVDAESLPVEIRKRHLDIQESMKKKWLNGLSGEARARLTPEERQFSLAYTILVQATDLEKVGEGPKPPSGKKPSPEPKPAKAEAPPKAAPKPAKVESAPKAPKAEVSPKVQAAAKAPAPPKAAAKPPKEHSITPNDLTAAEIAHLKEREKALKGRK